MKYILLQSALICFFITHSSWCMEAEATLQRDQLALAQKKTDAADTTKPVVKPAARVVLGTRRTLHLQNDVPALEHADHLEDMVKHLELMQFLRKANGTAGDILALEAIRELDASPELRQAFSKTTLNSLYSRNTHLTEIAHWAFLNQEKISGFKKSGTLVAQFVQEKLRFPTIITSDSMDRVGVPYEVYQFFPLSRKGYWITKDGQQAYHFTQNSYKLPFKVNIFSLVVMREALCLVYNYLKQPDCKTSLATSDEDALLIRALLAMLTFYKEFENLPTLDLIKLAIELEVQPLASAVVAYIEKNYGEQDLEKWIEQLPIECCTKLANSKANSLFILKCIRMKLLNDENPALTKLTDACISSIIASLFSEKITFTQDLSEALGYPPFSKRLREHLLSSYRLEKHEIVDKPAVLHGSLIASFCIKGAYQLAVSTLSEAQTVTLIQMKDGTCLGEYQLPEYCKKAFLLDDSHCALVTATRIIVLEINPHVDPSGGASVLKVRGDFPVHGDTACARFGERELIVADNLGITRIDLDGQQLQRYVQESHPIKGIAARNHVIVAWQADGTVFIWNKKGECATVQINDAVIQAADILPDMTILVSLQGKGVRFLGHEGQLLKKLMEEENNHTVCAWTSFNDSHIALGYENGLVCLWDVYQQKVVKRIVPPVARALPHSLTMHRGGILYVSYSTGHIAKVFLPNHASVADLVDRVCARPKDSSLNLGTTAIPSRPLSVRVDSTSEVIVFSAKKEFKMPLKLYEHCELLGLAPSQEVLCILRSNGGALNLMNLLWLKYNLPDLFKSDPIKAAALTTEIIQWSIANTNTAFSNDGQRKQAFENLRFQRPITLATHDNRFEIRFDKAEIRFFKKENVSFVCKEVFLPFTLFVFRDLLYLIANIDFMENVSAPGWKDNEEQLIKALTKMLEHYAPLGEISFRELFYLAQEFDVPPVAHAVLYYVRSKKLQARYLDISASLTPKLAELLSKNNANKPFLFTLIWQNLLAAGSPRSQGLKNVLDECTPAFVESFSQETLTMNPYFITGLNAGKHASLITDELQVQLIEKFRHTRRKVSNVKQSPAHEQFMEVLHLLITGEKIMKPQALFLVKDPLLAFAYNDGVVILWDRILKKKLSTITPDQPMPVANLTADENKLNIMYADGTVTNHFLK